MGVFFVYDESKIFFRLKQLLKNHIFELKNQKKVLVLKKIVVPLRPEYK